MNALRRSALKVLGKAAQMLVPGYEVAGMGWRTSRYQPGNSGPNALIQQGGNALRAWSRDLARKNAWAANALDSWTANAIGTGIVPRSNHPDPKRRKELHSWWLRWTDEADANGNLDLYGIQAQTVRSTMEAGEVFTRIRWRRPEDRLFLPMQLQVIEAEHVPLEMHQDLPNGNVVRWGIEYNFRLDRLAYHMYPERPGETQFWSDGQVMSRVPARSVIHNFKVLRPGLQRGTPWATPVLIKLWELDQYDDAELVRKKEAAFVTWVLKVASTEDNYTLGKATGKVDDTGTPIESIEPGSTITLPPGYDATPSHTADIGGQYSAFMDEQLHAIAVGYGITYEQLTGKLLGVTFSSIRAGILEFRRKCEQYQHLIVVHQFCRPVWRAFIEACVLAGLIDPADYSANYADYLNVEWRTPKWDWVSPLDEAKTEVLLIDNLLKPRSDSMAAMGEDAEVQDEKIATEQKRERDLGLVRRTNTGDAARSEYADPKSQPVQ